MGEIMMMIMIIMGTGDEDSWFLASFPNSFLRKQQSRKTVNLLQNGQTKGMGTVLEIIERKDYERNGDDYHMKQIV